MRKAMLIALFTALVPVLCGCQDTGEVENQAYVLVLALLRDSFLTVFLAQRVLRKETPRRTGSSGKC